MNLGIATLRNVPPPDCGRSVGNPARGVAETSGACHEQPVAVFAGYGVAAVIGIALGLAIGRSRAAGDLLAPPLELLRPIPAVARILLSILMFPSSELSMV
ncbi:hypothetical protein [Bradyrhizobium brasilense]|uniref:hypothetical protein n=1 Tax=Bradyrhizobium brasilense TaxID=1419277 RepID=UPI001E34E4B3|nr:hypothetical protein [Bradyrhizobium brasilense]